MDTRPTRMLICFVVVTSLAAICVLVMIVTTNNNEWIFLKKTRNYNQTEFKTSVFVDFNCTNTSVIQKLTVKQEHWQAVGNSSDLYVFSAYYCHEHNSVQIIAITKLREKAKHIFCIFKNENLTNRWIRVPGKLEIIPEHHNHVYTPAMLTCPTGDITRPETMEVVREGSHTMPVSLELRYPTQDPVKFTVCFPAIHSGYKNKEELIQTLTMTAILGAKRLYLYDNAMAGSMKKVVNYFILNGVLELISWKPPVNKIHYIAQLAAVHDCLLRNRYISEYIVFQDLDEIIAPKQDLAWAAMMERLSKIKPNAGSFTFRHSYFHNYSPKNDTTSTKDERIKKHKLYILQRLLRDKDVMAWNIRSKFIVKPKRVILLGIHSVRSYETGFSDYTIEPELGLLQHYRQTAPHSSRAPHNDTTMTKYERVLVESVAMVWKCLRKWYRV